MAIEAPVSKFTKTNLKIYAGICVVLAIIFAYDGYLSKYKWSRRYDFYKKEVLDHGGKATFTMNFNRFSPPVFLAGAVLFTAYLLTIRNRKLVAEEKELVLGPQKRIAYDSIQRIDKTHFESKGFFVITYKDSDGKEADHKLTKKKYDNLADVLDHLVAKIS
jgi:hypothetical protein